MFNIEETAGVYYIHHIKETDLNISNHTVSSKWITETYDINVFDIVSMAMRCEYYLNKYAMFYFKTIHDAEEFIRNVLEPLEIPNKLNNL